MYNFFLGANRNTNCRRMQYPNLWIHQKLLNSKNALFTSLNSETFAWQYTIFIKLRIKIITKIHSPREKKKNLDLFSLITDLCSFLYLQILFSTIRMQRNLMILLCLFLMHRLEPGNNKFDSYVMQRQISNTLHTYLQIRFLVTSTVKL